jgi:hypothetical protein
MSLTRSSGQAATPLESCAVPAIQACRKLTATLGGGGESCDDCQSVVRCWRCDRRHLHEVRLIVGRIHRSRGPETIMHRAHTAARTAAWLLASALAIDCGEPTKPHASLTATVVSEPTPRSTASANGSPFWTGGFSVDVLVKNQSDVAAQIDMCGGPELEVESQPDVWTSAGVPMCALTEGTSGMIDVPPRGERQWSQPVYPPSSAVPLSPRRVRLLFRYWTVGTSGEADELRSTPFELN